MSGAENLPDWNPLQSSLLLDRDIFPGKQILVKQMIHLLGVVQQRFKDTASRGFFPFPQNCHLENGRITKGENLEGYPYIVLDYPRLIEGKHLFLFRTLAWFGHGFSVSFVGSGAYRPKAAAHPEIWMTHGPHIWENQHLSGCYRQGGIDQHPDEPIRLLIPLSAHQPNEVWIESEKAFSLILEQIRL